MSPSNWPNLFSFLQTVPLTQGDRGLKTAGTRERGHTVIFHFPKTINSTNTYERSCGTQKKEEHRKLENLSLAVVHWQ